MDKKIPVIVVTAAIIAKAILPSHHESVQPHTETTAPKITTIISTSLGSGNGPAVSATLKLIADDDLMVMPHTGEKISISELRAAAESSSGPPLPTGMEIHQLS